MSRNGTLMQLYPTVIWAMSLALAAPNSISNHLTRLLASQGGIQSWRKSSLVKSIVTVSTTPSQSIDSLKRELKDGSSPKFPNFKTRTQNLTFHLRGSNTVGPASSSVMSKSGSDQKPGRVPGTDMIFTKRLPVVSNI